MSLIERVVIAFEVMVATSAKACSCEADHIDTTRRLDHFEKEQAVAQAKHSAEKEVLTKVEKPEEPRRADLVARCGELGLTFKPQTRNKTLEKIIKAEETRLARGGTPLTQEVIVPVTVKPAPSLEEVRSAAKVYSQKFGMPALIDLFNDTTGVEGISIPQLEPDHIIALMTPENLLKES